VLAEVENMPANRRLSSRHPCNDVSAYVRLKRIALAHEITSKKKIYLDTKYWALLRDARLGRSPNSTMAELLACLEALVRNGHAICPLNADVFLKSSSRATPRH